jgi:pimeloyl-ACP methyl ester carboxylesterase
VSHHELTPLATVESRTAARRGPRGITADSYAHWAHRPDGRLVVFVHGWGGSAEGSWRDFPQLLRKDPAAANVDLVFFGYRSRSRQAFASSEQLRSFLQELVLFPLRYCRYERPTEFRYRSLIIAAHSMGAVVARRALLEIRKKHDPSLDISRLVLFAPADHGATDLIRLHEHFPEWIGAAAKVLAVLAQSIKDLKPESAFLRNLRKESAAMVSSGSKHLLASRIFYASDDNVVLLEDPNEGGAFLTGEARTPVYDVSHSKICKPRSDYLLPISAIAEALRP